MALLPASVFAQGTATPGSPEAAANNARIKLGPIALNPTLALTNAGVDSNVFNEPDQLAPKSDFTMTVTPATDLYLRLGRSWLTSNVREDLVYYKTYSGERSANTSYTGGLYVPLNRLTLRAGGTYVNARDRPGFEIDARSQRVETGYNGSVEVRALAKTYFGVRGDRRKTSYDKAAVFLDANLQFELNRTVTTGALTVRHDLTPLTSVTLDVSRAQDRFEFSSLRDSNSTAVMVGLQFDPFALIKGTARLGYRDFKPLNGSLNGYQGSTAAVDLSYVAFNTTKFGVQFARDVQYSYDVNQPYYVQTGGQGSISQQLYGPFDVVGRAGIQRLDYQTRTGVIVADPNRTDYVRTYGGGAGYHLGKDVRVGFNIDQQRRTSDIDARTYSGLRYGIAVTYGS